MLTSDANLTGAHFCRTDLYETILSRAILHRANLQGTQLAMTNLEGAQLIECKIYGMSAWDLKLDGALQKDLNIIYKRENVNGEWEESHITVGDLETAQFIYLLLNNPKIRNAINTITRKVVLILGRFSEERKKVLDALCDALQEKDLVPVVFDFKQSENRDLTETVQLLANMAKFVITDITDAKSTPQELSHIIPSLPSVPVKPILLEKEKAYSTFEHWPRYPWVLPIFYYKDKAHLVKNIELEILNPIEDWENKEDKILEQTKKFEELKKNDPHRYEQLKEEGITID
ncbi:MAG: pentapeptide repeat-containing protein [Bacteroidota bacterium]|nr:pentapeptide repeat-containing protein [Bacteroidota bacterium]